MYFSPRSTTMNDLWYRCGCGHFSRSAKGSVRSRWNSRKNDLLVSSWESISNCICESSKTGNLRKVPSSVRSRHSSIEGNHCVWLDWFWTINIHISVMRSSNISGFWMIRIHSKKKCKSIKIDILRMIEKVTRRLSRRWWERGLSIVKSRISLRIGVNRKMERTTQSSAFGAIHPSMRGMGNPPRFRREKVPFW